jgi:proline iminopeptidase
MRELYPPVAPYKTGRLAVSPVHTVYYEEAGNPEGRPVLFLHGGPGGGIAPLYRQYFDPAAYRIVLLDQRGAGQSTPHAHLEDNSTWHLVSDIEALREQLGLEKWVVFGGSWGSTLSLAYAQTHPERVKALVLRGIFLCRPKEIEWFYQHGAHAIFPDFWEHYESAIPPEERGDMLNAFYRRLTSDDEQTRLAAAQAWSVWEGSASKLFPSDDLKSHFGDPRFALAMARIECHYFVNNAFFPTDNYLIENVGKIRHIPAVIVQGRYDVVCPMMSAWELHQAWPEAEFHVIPDAGHSITEPGIVNALVQATDNFRQL